jgi:hypothetical protein
MCVRLSPIIVLGSVMLIDVRVRRSGAWRG